MKQSSDISLTRPDTLSDPLCPEDRMLWETVVRDVRPLSSCLPVRNDSDPVLQSKPETAAAEVSFAGQLSPSGKNIRSHRLNAFDSTVHRKIARGRLHIEARVDLHGLTQKQAYSLLLHFVQSAQYRGLRHVLVITGKGASSGGDGILRQAVPHWLATVPFRVCVNAFESAARHHGGHGALYVRLRRLPSGHAL